MMANGAKYGQPANQFRAQAQELNPENPCAMYLAATEKLDAPKAFGGDKDAAKALLN